MDEQELTLEEIKEQTKKGLDELLEVAKLKPGQILVVGCSSSEVGSFRIGSHSSAEIGEAICSVLYSELKAKGIYPLSAVSI